MGGRYKYRYRCRTRTGAERGALKQGACHRYQQRQGAISGMDIDEVVDLARSMQARASLSSLHGSARGQGLGELSIEDIDAEVAAVRAAR